MRARLSVRVNDAGRSTPTRDLLRPCRVVPCGRKKTGLCRREWEVARAAWSGKAGMRFPVGASAEAQTMTPVMECLVQRRVPGFRSTQGAAVAGAAGAAGRAVSWQRARSCDLRAPAERGFVSGFTLLMVCAYFTTDLGRTVGVCAYAVCAGHFERRRGTWVDRTAAARNRDMLQPSGGCLPARVASQDEAAGRLMRTICAWLKWA